MNAIGELIGNIAAMFILLTVMFLILGVPLAIVIRLCRWIIGI